MKFICLLSLSIATILPVAGCGKSGSKTYPVEGTVTYRGKNLPTGVVMFVPDAKGVKPFTAKIDANGRYQTEIAEGSYAVQILMHARLRSKAAPTKDKDMDTDTPVVDWLIPEKYGSIQTSGLTANVKAEESQTIDFPLK